MCTVHFRLTTAHTHEFRQIKKLTHQLGTVPMTYKNVHLPIYALHTA